MHTKSCKENLQRLYKKKDLLTQMQSAFFDPTMPRSLKSNTRNILIHLKIMKLKSNKWELIILCRLKLSKNRYLFWKWNITKLFSKCTIITTRLMKRSKLNTMTWLRAWEWILRNLRVPEDSFNMILKSSTEILSNLKKNCMSPKTSSLIFLINSSFARIS